MESGKRSPKPETVVAAKFSRKGGRIHMTARQMQHAVLISVRDSGHGTVFHFTLPRAE